MNIATDASSAFVLIKGFARIAAFLCALPLGKPYCVAKASAAVVAIVLS